MASRAADWLEQAERDLELARHASEIKLYEWSCFAAQQVAEKAVKGLFQELHLEAWGHVVHDLLGALPASLAVPAPLLDKARRLDRHYIPTRYPNGFETGMPGDYYTAQDARQAIAEAEDILAYCRDQIT